MKDYLIEIIESEHDEHVYPIMNSIGDSFGVFRDPLGLI